MARISFSKLISRQVLLMGALSFLIATLFSTITALILLNQAADNRVHQLEKITQKEIEQHLTTGWQKSNIEQIYQHLKHLSPDEQFYLLKGPKFREQPIDDLLPKTLHSLLTQIETKQEKTIPFSYFQGYIAGGHPIFLSPNVYSVIQNIFKPEIMLAPLFSKVL